MRALSESDGCRTGTSDARPKVAVSGRSCYLLNVSEMCSTCREIAGQDPLQVKTLEIEQTIHNSCAPITHFTCKCRTCGTRWLAMEIYDEDGIRPSEWSWERAPAT